MGKRTGRKRGAPVGNTNRLTHGRYSAAAKAQREARRIQWEEIMLLSAWTDVITRMDRLQRMGVPTPLPEV
jgi:uncharacterized protein YjcR